jgi:hypothetical protein
MSMGSFREWYMARYWEFDNLFLMGAELLGVTYHEFVLTTLVIIWPLVTLTMGLTILKLWHANRRLIRAGGTN